MSKWNKTCSDLPGVKDQRLTEDQHSLILDNMGLLWQCYHQTWPRMCLTEIQKENLLDHLQNKLIRAAQGFDKTRGFRFSTYATWCLKSGVRDFLGRLHRRIITVNYDDAVSDGGDELPLERLISREETDPIEGLSYEELVERIRSVVGDHDTEILIKRHVLGVTLNQLGAEGNYSKERARQILFRIRERLQERLVAQ